MRGDMKDFLCTNQRRPDNKKKTDIPQTIRFVPPIGRILPELTCLVGATGAFKVADRSSPLSHLICLYLRDSTGFLEAGSKPTDNVISPVMLTQFRLQSLNLN